MIWRMPEPRKPIAEDALLDRAMDASAGMRDDARRMVEYILEQLLYASRLECDRNALIARLTAILHAEGI